MFQVGVLADSVGPTSSRLVTMELTYPRCIHSEFMTHRMFSRNAASSRAIPIEKMIDRVNKDPFIPSVWGLNQKGMQASKEHKNADDCIAQWLEARDAAVKRALIMHNELHLYKQIVNRILEPWMWITVIATGVDHAWENFFGLRCHPDAEPHIQQIAYMARELFDLGVTTRHLKKGEHLPLFGFNGDESLSGREARAVSTARCARVSYLTHDGKRDVVADLGLHNRLADNGHWSPFEHVATAMPGSRHLGGNFGDQWEQYRKTFVSEYCRKAPR